LQALYSLPAAWSAAHPVEAWPAIPASNVLRLTHRLTVDILRWKQQHDTKENRAA
jgi:hypothetical protein